MTGLSALPTWADGTRPHIKISELQTIKERRTPRETLGNATAGNTRVPVDHAAGKDSGQ